MMAGNGLVKLMEECGELVQIAAKKLAYSGTDAHPDGRGSMRERLQDEIGDVFAACDFVSEVFGLSPTAIAERRARKLRLFRRWHREETE